MGVVVFDGTPTLTDNSITGNTTGLTLAGTSAPTLSGNHVCDNETNLTVSGDCVEVSTDGNFICEDALATN